MSLSAFKKFLNDSVIQIPMIIPIGAMGGYLIGGTKGALIGATSSLTDLALKYYNVEDSYYATFGFVGALLGKDLGAHLIFSAIPPKATYTDTQTTMPNEQSNTNIAISSMKLEYIDKILSVSLGCAGMLLGKAVNEMEQFYIDYSNGIYSYELVRPEEILEL